MLAQHAALGVFRLAEIKELQIRVLAGKIPTLADILIVVFELDIVGVVNRIAPQVHRRHRVQRIP